MVVKRSGHREPFDRAKLVAGVRAACKNRPVSDEALQELAQQVEESLRVDASEPTHPAGGPGRARAARRRLDEVAYLRFASVYKGFEDVGDFQREVGLLTKTTEPKRRG